jgi:hypothetical protein
VKRSQIKRDQAKAREWERRHRGSLQADPEKTRQFVERSREAARDRARLFDPVENAKAALRVSRTPPRATEAPSRPMGRANPPRGANGDSGARHPKSAFRDDVDVCRCCGRGGFRQNHHVVFEQHVRAEGGDVHDPRNALSLHPNPCHYGTAHTGKLKLSCLRDENYAFAAELLGSAAHNYLRRRYAGEDPRLDELRKIEATDRPLPADVRRRT